MTTHQHSDALTTRERQLVTAVCRLLASREAHLGSWAKHDHESPRYKAWRQGLSAMEQAAIEDFDALVKLLIKDLLERELAA